MTPNVKTQKTTNRKKIASTLASSAFINLPKEISMKSSTPINTNSHPSKKEESSLTHTPTYKPAYERSNIDTITPIPELTKTQSQKSKISKEDKTAKHGSDKKAKEAKEKEKKLKQTTPIK